MEEENEGKALALRDRVDDAISDTGSLRASNTSTIYNLTTNFTSSDIASCTDGSNSSDLDGRTTAERGYQACS
jgi:hypothetical protein